MTILRIGLIGAGRFGQTLAQVASTVPEFQITAIHDTVTERSEAVVRLLGDTDIHVCQQTADMWPFVDAVFISTSHDTHVTKTLEAASAGKHIFCEKPMAIDAAECQAMIDTADRHAVKLLIGQVTRLMPVMVRLRAVLNSGVIGRPVAMHIMRAAWMERAGWWAITAASGGMLHSPAAHIYDLMNSLFGRAVSVYAVAAPRIQPQVDFDDTIFSTLVYNNGVIATFNTSISGQTWIYEGRLIADGGSLQFATQNSGTWLEYQPRGKSLVREDFGSFDQEGLDGVAAELRNFADLVLNDAPPYVTNQEAMEAVAMIQATYESVRTGSVIALPVSENLRVQ
jgi:myo-inositol 2-dehydrogenase / D-chiro-inositol 1-dehydrogenase